jgi:hypothetical protein
MVKHIFDFAIMITKNVYRPIASVVDTVHGRKAEHKMQRSQGHCYFLPKQNVEPRKYIPSYKMQNIPALDTFKPNALAFPAL